MATVTGPGISDDVIKHTWKTSLVRKLQAASHKPQALDSWSRILYDAFRKREKNMITDKEYKILMTDVYRKIITAVNITTGDDGTKAHKVIETFSELWKMNKKEYEQQQKYFG